MPLTVPILPRSRAAGAIGWPRSMAWRVAWLAMILLAGGVRAEDDAPASGDGVRMDAEAPLALDPLRSSAEFEVKVLWLIGVHGRFGKVQGTITFDRAHDSVVADARIDVGTITMRSHSYEEWVKSAEFFDAANFPQIHFASEPFSPDRLRGGGELAGTLTVRGIDRHIALKIEPSQCPDAVAQSCAVEVSGSIQRSDFGMRSRPGTLSDKVELRFSIYLAPANGEEAPSR